MKEKSKKRERDRKGKGGSDLVECEKAVENKTRKKIELAYIGRNSDLSEIEGTIAFTIQFRELRA